jgi:hypothetical protein
MTLSIREQESNVFIYCRLFRIEKEFKGADYDSH